MRFLDAALAEVSRAAVVLMPGPTGQTFTVDAWAAHRGHGQVADLEVVDGRPNLHNLGEGLMTDHQMVISRWRCSVLERTDLPVSTANPDLEHVEPDLIRLNEPGDFVIDDFDFS